jgi:hypothetical protein
LQKPAEGAGILSQEILFFLFMIVELSAILLLYQLVIIPRIALKTNNLFEERMLDKTWDIPAMLEDYTEHLAIVFSEIIKKLVPQVVGGFMSAGNKQLRADPENVMQIATAEFLDSLPPSARMVANMALPRIQDALSKSETSPELVQVKYEPGLNKR